MAFLLFLAANVRLLTNSLLLDARGVKTKPTTKGGMPVALQRVEVATAVEVLFLCTLLLHQMLRWSVLYACSTTTAHVSLHPPA